jgi:DNA-binding GntR family transcriptional regulator
VRKIRIPDNLTTLAYKTIKNFILEGRLDEGSRLTEEFLSVQLGISKSPIREALNRLESEGLIHIEPRRGAYLRPFSIKEIEELYDLREALEVHAAATARVTPELVGELEESVRRAQGYLEANDKLHYIEEDIHFHHLIANATGNQRLAKTLENLQLQVWLFRRKTYDLSGSTAVSLHSAIAKALAKGDRDKAQVLMREHIADVRTKLLRFLASHPVDRQPKPESAAAIAE